MRNIDIEGSLYDCDYDRSNLPAYDKDKTIYECGSNIFNVLYYIWLGIITAISMALLMLWNYRKDFTARILLICQWIENCFRWCFSIESIRINYKITQFVPCIRIQHAFNSFLSFLPHFLQSSFRHSKIYVGSENSFLCTCFFSNSIYLYFILDGMRTFFDFDFDFCKTCPAGGVFDFLFSKS